jgi:hypothetical protein
MLESLPIGPNPGQQNFDNLQNEINNQATEGVAMPDSSIEGRPFLTGEHNLFGYNGVVIADGKVVSLVNLDEASEIPRISIGDEVLLKGDTKGYVPSGHQSGQRVEVVALTEPFLRGPKGTGTDTSDRIIQVSGEGLIGWVKPSNIDKVDLANQKEQKLKQLFTPKS